MPTTLPVESGRSGPGGAIVVALATALAYSVVGAASLLLAGPPGYASPLYPSAGIALAAVLVFGRNALPGVWLGAFAVNAGLGLLRLQHGWALVQLPLLIGAGATLQAWAGATLVRRFVPTPVVLNAPVDVLRAGLLGALVACTVSPSIATPALLMQGVLGADQWPSNWLTWWLGDTLGVLIGAPLALAAIGRPAADWVPRRRSLGVPLLLALALLAAALVEIRRADDQRLQAAFERDADRLAHLAQTRLSDPLHALQSLHAVARLQGDVDQSTLRETAGWWLAQPMQLQAMGYSVRVSADEVAAFETRARAEGDAGYRVFDRDEGRARAEDGEVVALRHIEPRAGNSAALGVNALSVPAARAAIVTTRRSGQPVATAGFRLTQAIGDQTGVVIYQALYGREGGREVGSEAERQAQFRGVVFVTVDTGRIMAGLASSDPDYLQWCLVDPTPATARARLAGPAGCETAIARARTLQSRRALTLAGRPVQLLISADEAAVPGPDAVARWLLATMGMAATAMLGALLLTVTGHSRRTELAVEAGTAVLRHEIAERTQVERALRDSEERLRAILDHVPLGVMFVDPQGALLECNPKLCDMLGRSASELRGRSVAEFMDGDLLAAARLQRREPQAASPPPRLEPVRLRHADGRDRLVRVVTSALRDGQGRLTRVVAVLEDVTEHLRLQASERSLQRAEAASLAKSEFLSRMSHELRTPLNAMIGFAQLLDMQSAGALDAKQRDWTQHIQHAGWHLLELINETLDLARIESGAMQLTLVPVALAPAIASCQAMVAATASEHGVSLTVAPGLHVPAVLGDATRVKQVLTNLLSNAIKYNRRGGGVTLSTRMAGDGQVEIAVADTGLGMTDEQVQELFQPYNRLGRDGSGIEGTGIGLVISRRLADLMGGSLGVSSRAGEGSTFTLRLPAAALAAAVEAPLDTAAPAPYPERLVHYVEDNETNVLVMQGVLAQRPQIELQTTTLGLDALSAVRARRPDLILLDMHLPDISGIELLRHLKGDDDLAPIPVIAVSADATPAHIERALTMGARHYVTKPFDLRAFLQIVDEVLHESDTRW